MKAKTSLLVAVAAAALPCQALAGAATDASAPKEAGLWYDDTGKGAVKIEVCGNKLCGKIYWLKNPLNDEGKPLFDRHNPNEAQQTRPICGLQVFGNLAPMADGTWDTGWIYDPKEGKSYSLAMQLTDQDTLKVTGYLVMKIMGQTFTWKRAPQDLPPCAQNAAAPAAPDAAKKASADTKAPPAKAGGPKGGEVLPWSDKPTKPAPAGASKSSGQSTQKTARP